MALQDHPLPRRFVSFNLPIPSALHRASSSTHGAAEPGVQVDVAKVEQEIFPNVGSRARVATHASVPTSNNNGSKDIEPQPIEPPGIVLKDGINVGYYELVPGGRIPTHRTTSTDYVFILEGQLTLLTPKEPFDGSPNGVGWEETVVKAGDVSVQRGTLHGWRNNTERWVKWWCVVIGSESISTAVEGGSGADRHELADVFVDMDKLGK